MSLDIDETHALRRTTITGSPVELFTVREFFQALCSSDDHDALCSQLSAKENTIVSRYAFALGIPLPPRESILASLENPSTRQATFELFTKKSFSWEEFDNALVSLPSTNRTSTDSEQRHVLKLAGGKEEQSQDVSDEPEDRKEQ